VDRDAFFALPAAVAIRVLFDCLDEETVRAIGNAEKPVAPRCPKFDRKIFRQGGVMWASECSIECLSFWRTRALQPATDSKYEEANRKQAEELGRWIAWREWYPDAAWGGERDRDQVTAKPPSDKPTVYPRSGNGQRPAPPPPDEDINADSEIPF
jgi:hypothetical protein